MSGRAARVMRALFGERPRALVLVVAPTLLAIALDFALRARALIVYPPKEALNYFGSSLASAGFWAGPLWLTSRLFLVREGRSRLAARVALGAFYGLFVLPLAIFCYGGQALYHGVFHAYMARDTVRLGIALRGTLGAWLSAWGGSAFAMVLAGLVTTALFAFAARRAAPALASATPIVPVLAFAGASYCFWVDFVESRSLQAAPPDTCFIHGVVHAIHDGVTGKGWVRRGISLRTPDPLPEVPKAAHRPNVLIILSESVRADAFCSEPPPRCQAPFLDEVAKDRVALGRLTSQSSGTFSACMVLWTGMPPSVDFQTAHRAPVLWEIAKAAGYRTGYLTSQNLRYDDFGAFVKRAGIDVMVSAMELGDTRDPHVGAPDEAATAQALAFARETPAATPYFAVLHLSNTHWPYRVDPALQHFSPHSDDPFDDVSKLHNHYRNSVRMQERTVAEFLRALEALPSWDDTVVIFLSDHGEQFREHGGLYHINSLFDEEVRVPGWLLAGSRALDEGQRASLSLLGRRRTYSQDVQATVVDLLGAWDARGAFPFASLATGRSLVRMMPSVEPAVIMSTASGVWEPNDPKFGVLRDDELLVGTQSTTWQCYAMRSDRLQLTPGPKENCGNLVDAARAAFPSAGVPEK
jgi:hypothetical protein